MLTTLHSNVLANYAAVLAPEKHLLSFVSLSPETTYFLVCYQSGSQKGRSSTALMWRAHDVLELVDYVGASAGGRIHQFSALTYACTQAGSRLEYRDIKEFWVAREPDHEDFIFSYMTDDGVSHIGHGATPSDGRFESLLRVF